MKKNLNVMILNVRHIPICCTVYQSSDFYTDRMKPLCHLHKTVFCFWRLQFAGREECVGMRLCAVMCKETHRLLSNWRRIHSQLCKSLNTQSSLVKWFCCHSSHYRPEVQEKNKLGTTCTVIKMTARPKHVTINNIEETQTAVKAVQSTCQERSGHLVWTR